MVTVLWGDVASGLCGGCLPIDLELMDVQAVDLELLDLEVSDHRSPDRKPADGQGADGTGANGCCADCGRAEASRSKLHRGRLLPAGTEPGKIPRERSAVVHELLLLCPPRTWASALAASVRFSNSAAASQNAQTDMLVVFRRGTRLLLPGPANITVSRSAPGQSLARIASATR
jgi:hypothetical protein